MWSKNALTGRWAFDVKNKAAETVAWCGTKLKWGSQVVSVIDWDAEGISVRRQDDNVVHISAVALMRNGSQITFHDPTIDVREPQEDTWKAAPVRRKQEVTTHKEEEKSMNLVTDVLKTLGINLHTGIQYELALAGGIAVPVGPGQYRGYNKDTKTVIQLSAISPVKDKFFILPVMTVSVGDLIEYNGKARFVDEIAADGSLTATTVADGERVLVSAQENEFGFALYNRVFCVSTLLGLDSYGSILNQFLKGDRKVFQQYLPLMLGAGAGYSLLRKHDSTIRVDFLDKLLPAVAATGIAMVISQITTGGGSLSTLKAKFEENKALFITAAVVGIYLYSKKQIATKQILEVFEEHKTTILLVAGAISLYMYKSGGLDPIINRLKGLSLKETTSVVVVED